MYLNGMTTVAEQSERFLSSLQTRRRNSVRPATIKVYDSMLRNWILPNLGDKELSSIENGTMKQFVTHLVEKGLSPASISVATSCLKALIGSETDANGNRLHPRDWNNDFIDAPKVSLEAQNTPIPDVCRLNAALLAAPKPYQAFFVLQTASGLRMGEMLALRAGPNRGTESFLDLSKKMVYIRSQIKDRVEQPPKSAAGVREVDLCTSVCDWLKEHLPNRVQGEYIFATKQGIPWYIEYLYRNMEEIGLPGTHSLRRFRTTHLENMSVPRVLVDYWIGHKGKSVTDRYTKLGQSIRARKNWCKRAGLGFQLPGAGEEKLEFLYNDTEGIEEIL
jgi:site-specific recombinase XerC